MADDTDAVAKAMQAAPTAEPADISENIDSFDVNAVGVAGNCAGGLRTPGGDSHSGSDRAESVSPLSSVPSSMRASPHFTPPTPRTPLATPTAEKAGQFQGLDVEALAAALQRSASGRDGKPVRRALDEQQEALVSTLTEMGFESGPARVALERTVSSVLSSTKHAAFVLMVLYMIWHESGHLAIVAGLEWTGGGDGVLASCWCT